MCIFLFKFHIWNMCKIFGICATFQKIWFHLSEYDVQTSQILDSALFNKINQLFFTRPSNLPWLSAALLTFLLKSNCLTLISLPFKIQHSFFSNISRSSECNSSLLCLCCPHLQRGHLAGFPLSPEVRRFSPLFGRVRGSPGPVDGAEEPLLTEISAPFTAIWSSSRPDMCN